MRPSPNKKQEVVSGKLTAREISVTTTVRQ